MRIRNPLHFDALARDLAMRVGATVRRWWLEPTNPQCFYVEAVRTFVGAKPVVVQFTAMLDTARPPQLRGQPQMQVIAEAPLAVPERSTRKGTTPAVPRQPRTARRTRAAQTHTRTRRTSTTRPKTTPTRAPSKTQRRSRPRARR